MGDRKYDVVLCCGVLMLFNQQVATQAIKAMLAHTKGLLGIISLANPQVDNAQLRDSYLRPENLYFVHNVDEMVYRAGGSVVFRDGPVPTKSPATPATRPCLRSPERKCKAPVPGGKPCAGSIFVLSCRATSLGRTDWPLHRKAVICPSELCLVPTGAVGVPIAVVSIP